MFIAPEDLRNTYVERELETVINPVSNIYDERLQDPVTFPKFQRVPNCIYFFYIRINDNGALVVDHYLYFEGPADDPDQWAEIPYGQVDDKIKMLAYNARPSGAGIPAPLPQHNFENVVLRRKSYVAFFLDEANWAFHKRLGGRFAMAFNEGKSQTQNHSFFDAKDLEFQMNNLSTGIPDTRTGVVLVNHMKQANGDDLTETPPHPTFAFDMFFDVNFEVPSPNKLTVIFDPGGTNQGPPLNP